MVVVEWSFVDEDTGIKISKNKDSVTLHFIPAQGTLMVSLSPEQVEQLKNALEKSGGYK